MLAHQRSLTPPENTANYEVQFTIDDETYSGTKTKLVVARGHERVPFRVDEDDEATLEGTGELPNWCAAVLDRLELSLNTTA